LSDFIADTHAIVWHLTEPRRLGRGARRAFSAAEDGKGLCQVPAIALIEIALLHERGRLRLGAPQVAEMLASHRAYAVLPIDIQQCLEFAALVGIRDPMDRLVAAAARAVQARVVSSDGVFDGHVSQRIWD
jgi:PIN domain nuclease of toxin-antitoxin system